MAERPLVVVAQDKVYADHSLPFVGECDCCGRGPRVLSFSVVYGLDAWACGECRGDD